MALKGNLPEKASRSFQGALTLNPYLWEAFEGLCALGPFTLFQIKNNYSHTYIHTYIHTGPTPEIDELFPPRPLPVKRAPPEDVPSKPIATGAGFFTPDTGNGGNLFRSFKLDLQQPQPFRIGHPRDSMYVYIVI